MTRNRKTSLWMMIFLMMFAQIASAETIRVRTGVYRPDGVYKSGETAKFTVQALGELPAGGLPARYTITFNGNTTVSTGTVLAGEQPTVVTATSNKPGQMFCRFSFDVPTTGPKMIGAIYDPYQIKPSMRTPWDFGMFWGRQKKSLQHVYTPVVEPVPSKDPNAELFHVIIPMPEGRPVQGYMAKPRGAKPHSVGAILYTHGAGVRSSRIPNVGLGMIAMDINAHGIDDGMPAKYYDDLDRDALKNYRTNGRESRDTIYFRGMYLRLMRALDFLTRQPEWDGKVLVVYGGSQGGAQAIAAAGLDPRVSCIVSAYPALSDLTGYNAGRDSGWPHPIPLTKDGKCTNTRIRDAERYYDCVNFAKRTRADAFFMVGLIDTTCAPTSIMAAYNALGSRRKTIDIVPWKGHNSLIGKESRDATQFIKDHVARVKGQKKVEAEKKVAAK